MNHTPSTTRDAVEVLREPSVVSRMLTSRPIPLRFNDCLEHSARLWALSPQERIDAMWAGRLTLSQLTEWTRRRPSEVPLLGGEFAWIVMRTPEWDEPAAERHNVVRLPDRTRGDRVAA